jgi:glutamyl-tRNA synthetase
VQKLTAINGAYIRALPVDDFIARCAPWVPEAWRVTEAFRVMAPLVQERVKRLDEVPGMVDFLFTDDLAVDDAAWAKAMKAPAAEVLDGVIEAYGTVAWDAESLKAAAEAVGEQHGLKPSKAQAPVRAAITGRSVGPPLYDSIALLGRERTIARLQAARATL